MGVRNRDSVERNDGGVLIFLSLFLLLLAFFILLNAISTLELDRADAVIESIDERFRIDPTLLMSDTAVTSRAGAMVAAGETLQTLGRLFETEISVSKVERIDQGRTMVVTVPADALFAAGATDFLPAQTGLLDRVADALRNPPAGAVFDLDVLIGTEAAFTSIDATSLQLARAGAAGRLFADRGVPSAVLSVGLERRRDEEVRFLMTALPAGEPAAQVRAGGGDDGPRQ